MKKVSINSRGIKIKGIKCTEIEWCVEAEDVIDTEGMTEEEIDKAVEDIEAELPEEVYVPLDEATSDLVVVSDFIEEKLTDTLSDKYGWLVVGYNYKLIGEDDKEYNLK
jgi:hypothetical protein